MIENAFSMPILLDNFSLDKSQVELLKSEARFYLAEHGMESGNALSTAGKMRSFHELSELHELCNFVEEKADLFWHAYGLSKRYQPYIKESWINVHGQGGKTEPHYHSGSVMSAAYYIQFEPGNGDIKFVNPMEYHMCHEPREDDCDITVEIEQFDLIIFPGVLKHSTEPNYIDSERYVLTFNFDYKDREPVRHIFNESQ